jgi:hypothetical protein
MKDSLTVFAWVVYLLLNADRHPTEAVSLLCQGPDLNVVFKRLT